MLVTIVSPAKTAEQIEMPLGQTCVATMYWTGGVSPTRRGIFGGDILGYAVLAAVDVLDIVNVIRKEVARGDAASRCHYCGNLLSLRAVLCMRLTRIATVVND